MYSRHPTRPKPAARFSGMAFQNSFCAGGRGRALAPAGASLLPPFSHGCFLTAFAPGGHRCHAVLATTPSSLPHLCAPKALVPPAETANGFDGHSSSDPRAPSAPHPNHPPAEEKCPSHGGTEEERDLLPAGHVQGRAHAEPKAPLPVGMGCGVRPRVPGRSPGGRRPALPRPPPSGAGPGVPRGFPGHGPTRRAQVPHPKGSSKREIEPVTSSGKLCPLKQQLPPCRLLLGGAGYRARPQTSFGVPCGKLTFKPHHAVQA